jgi:hypothetical protein
LAGQTTTSTFNVTAVSGSTFLNPVTFACNNLPDTTVSCAFSQIAQGATSPQQVTVTVSTTGPNTGQAGVRQRRADNRSPWLPLALPLAGIVMAGFAGRKVWKHSAIVTLCAALVLLGLLVACGNSNTPQPINVTVNQGVPPSVFPTYPVGSSQTASFSATVTNSTNTAVTWNVLTASGGTIVSTGPTTATYTPPAVAAGLPTSVTITATSQADPTKIGSAQETLKPSTIPGTYNLTVTATEGTIQNTTSNIVLTVD